MNNRRDFLKTGALVTATALLASCQSNSDDDQPMFDESDPYAYAPNSAFLTRPDKGFNYYAFNNSDYDGQKRSEPGMDKHRPQVKISENKKELFVSFDGADKKHPHQAGHYWTWIEITDKMNKTSILEFPEPAKYDDFYGKDGKDFRAYFQFEEPLKGWIRVRACCKPHGQFLDYVNADA